MQKLEDLIRRGVAKVHINSAGRLFVMPRLDGDAAYEHIYREANGLRWDSTLHAIHAYEPERWEHVELLSHIADTLRSACGESLEIDQTTAWEGVPAELQVSLRAVLGQRA